MKRAAAWLILGAAVPVAAAAVWALRELMPPIKGVTR